MAVIEEVYKKRKKLADVLADEEYSGIRKIVEDLYPDKAHFIYELLQNAEDAEAEEVLFILKDDHLLFEHNGKPFSKGDVEGITNIGKGTKSDEQDKIGRFGVGFKAVFAYSETPYIWSPTFNFKISELVLPTVIEPRISLGENTLFEFPFNNEEKGIEDAYKEIKKGLQDLSEFTLLFLSNLNSIQWELGDSESGKISRVEHSENHVEIRKHINGNTSRSSHYLRFIERVKGLKKQYIAIAFKLEELSNKKVEEELSQQFKIVPAHPGRVAVFFPAEKETSNLKFHIHAPFVPELSRASIKETEVNDPLYKQLSKLAANSLHIIRDLNLLNRDFLEVLPNSQDEIPKRYQPIHEAIIREMQEKPLTPTYLKFYAPAKYLLQSKAPLKTLLSNEDLKFLIPFEDKPFQWVIGAKQYTPLDHFLSDLEIQEWSVNDFVSLMGDKTNENLYDGINQEFMNWLSSKSNAWHQQLYSLLYEEYEDTDNELWMGGFNYINLERLNIIKLSNGKYSNGSNCYFPTKEAEYFTDFPQVHPAVFTSGKRKKQQENSRRFLQKIGVREVGEGEEIQSILKKRYTQEENNLDNNIYYSDLNRFISFLEREPSKVHIFKEYRFLKSESDEWLKPRDLYADAPLIDTGLKFYYEVTSLRNKKEPLSSVYNKAPVLQKNFIKFLKKIDVQINLRIVKVSCEYNPKWNYLKNVDGVNFTSPLNEDYLIPGIKGILGEPTVDLAKLIWKTMCKEAKYSHLEARYRKNISNGCRTTDSRLVYMLKEHKWVPQKNGEFVRPAEASVEQLHQGFTYDEDFEWLNAVNFGEENKKKIEERRKLNSIVRELGFPDTDSLERAKKFATLPLDEQQRFLEEVDRKQRPELLNNGSGNSERRHQRVIRNAKNAPSRYTEKRERAVSIAREAVKQEAKEYLREQYTSLDGEMICQVCDKTLPFKINEEYYFETVEFLSNSDLEKRHYQNYLALCPNHSVMFKQANESQDTLKERLMNMRDNYLHVVLANEKHTVYFSNKQIIDLKAVIESEEVED